MTGRVCIVNYDRPRRGPKKGQLKSLYSRIEVLEEKLVVQLDHPEPELTGNQQDETQRTSSSPRRSSFEDEEDAPHEVSSNTSPAEIPLSSPHSSSGRRSRSGPIENIQQPLIYSKPSIIQADLDQLYFDRVHPIAPFLHQRRYFSWVDTQSPSLGRLCLRSAIRTVAAAMSAQFRGFSRTLYRDTLQLLQQLDAFERPPSIEQIQALLLLAHYEVLQMEASRAMVTAGRCFRLIQLSRLHDTDAVDSDVTPPPLTPTPSFNEVFAITEEKRRTFWVAYCFDRFLSSRHEWPLTLQEDAIRTRLPLPEPSFQATQPPQTPPPFLPEALSTSGHKLLPAFSETIVLATLHGRAMTLRRMAHVLTPPETPTFWTRHKSLSNLLEKRTQLLARNLPSPRALVEPMLAFTHFLARSTVVYVGEITEVVPWGGDEERLLSGAYMGRSIGAAREVARLVCAVRPVNCFKAHLFLPTALSRAAEFLATHTVVPEWEWGNPQGNREVDELLAVLRDLEVVNGLAREVLRELEGKIGSAAGASNGRVGMGAAHPMMRRQLFEATAQAP
ncbi:fungal-specific transcription factor domain-containing protein [Aspergillus crustosus]